MTTATKQPTADVSEIWKALDLFTAADGVAEIRALKIPGSGKAFTSSGYFQDLGKAAAAAAALDKRKAGGVYFVLNEINPALLARSPEQTTDYPDSTTSDNDIIRRRWLPIDFDPTRPAGISSSENEHCEAEGTARDCAAWLTAS